MGESKRRKKLDPNYGKPASDSFAVDFLVKFIKKISKRAYLDNLPSSKPVFFEIKRVCVTDQAADEIHRQLEKQKEKKLLPHLLGLHFVIGNENSTSNSFKQLLKIHPIVIEYLDILKVLYE